MSTTKATNQVHQGPSTAAITFTRNSNRGSRHATAGKQARVGNHPALLRSYILPCLASLVLLGIFSTGAQASGASGVSGSARWRILSVSNPTNFKPGDQSGADSVVVMVTNVGSGASDGSPVTISDVLPAGLTAVEVF